MAVSLQSENPDALGRKMYRVLASRCKRRGLVPSEIKRSRDELNCQTGSICHLNEIAYKPTGIALGCPVPDRRFARRLWYFSRLIEKYLAMLSVDEKPTFAFVPPRWHHITVVNRTHFDVNEASFMVSGYHLLSEGERRSAQAVISHTAGPLVIQFSGLILTSDGRLIVPGFPADDRLYELRYQLAKSLPQVRVKLPTTAHIKLGHILLDLKDDHLPTFLNWLALCGQHISARVAFSDLYTPTGRIVL